MATIESMIKFINKRMKAVSDYFGKNSSEYHKLKNLLYQNLGGGYDPLLKYNKGEVTINRSKTALEAFSSDSASEILEDVHREVMRMGTVKEMANEYFNSGRFNEKLTMKELSQPIFRDTVREMSYENYRAKYLDDDIYQEVNRLLLEESQKFGEDNYDETFYNALEEIHDVLTEKGRQRDYAYSIAEKMLNDAKLEHEKFLLQRALEKAGEESDLGENE